MLVEVKNLSFTYPEETKKALDDVSFSVREGEFTVLCGASGCGKSTLLRQLKTCLTPHGERTGEILFDGVPLSETEERSQAQRIGFVEQSPENQIVTDKVWHELAFGLESLGYETPVIRKRVAEMASFFGIEKWFYKNVTDLSGGQKQLLNLASVMVMNPQLLILDEPTSQLDPIAASDFIQVIAKINRELGTTVIITEHRLEEAFPQASRVIVMEKGKLIADGNPQEVGLSLRDSGAKMFDAMPSPMRIWAACSEKGDQRTDCPVTVRDGRAWIRKFRETHELRQLPPEVIWETDPETVILAEDVWFKYEKDGPDIVKGLNFSLHKGEFAALLGGNGTGKSTSLKVMQGICRPYRGKVRVTERIAALPQNPQTLFVKNSALEELYEVTEEREKVERISRICRLTELLERHPYDLSGGEQQRLALAKVLLTEPEILLLDEPTKGIDADFKYVLAKIIYELLAKGVSVLMVSHDVEFCARYAQRCLLFFDGNIISEGTPRAFFSDNSFYTTNANRMARGVVDGAVTAEDVMYALGATVYTPDEEFLFPRGRDGGEDKEPDPGEFRKTKKEDRLPRWRRISGAVTGAAALFLMFRVVFASNLTELVNGGKVTEKAFSQLPLYGLLLLLLVVTGVLLTGKQEADAERVPMKREKPGKRTVIAAVCILLLIPFTIFAGIRWIGNANYYITSFLVILECIAPFFLIFEGRKPQARELVIIAVMSALGVTGRLIFSMLPSFKPVIAVAVITGVALGAESGFLVGALTMLVSNFMMSQGPWTPWQMFSIGIIGFLAGVFYQKGFLRRNRESLAVFGAVMAIVVFGGIMNPASAVMWQGMSISSGSILAYYITGFPLDLVNATATFLFLWIGGEPILEKLDRVKVKYGLLG